MIVGSSFFERDCQNEQKRCAFYLFITTKDGRIDWLSSIPNPHNDNYGFADFVDTIDAIVMGRHTFETIASFDERSYTKEVLVLSNQYTSYQGRYHDKIDIIAWEIPKVVDMLHQQSLSRLYIDGGKPIQRFLDHAMIDEMTITTVLIVLGEGCFGRGNPSLWNKNYSSTM